MGTVLNHCKVNLSYFEMKVNTKSEFFFENKLK